MLDKFLVLKFKNDTNGIAYLDQIRKTTLVNNHFTYILDCSRETLMSIHKQKCLSNESKYYTTNPPPDSFFNDVKQIHKSNKKQNVLHIILNGDKTLIKFGNNVKNVDVLDYNDYSNKIHQNIVKSKYNDPLIVDDLVHEAFTLPNLDTMPSSSSVHNYLFDEVKNKIQILKRFATIIGIKPANVNKKEKVPFDEHFHMNHFLKWAEYIQELVSLQKSILGAHVDLKNKTIVKTRIIDILHNNNEHELTRIMFSPIKNIFSDKIFNKSN